MTAPGRSDGTGANAPLFDRAVALVDAGDVKSLERTLREHPELVSARATTTAAPYDGYFWGATLLHHTAGNPIRGRLPGNVDRVARTLLDAGADPNATCGGGPSQPESAGGTTLGLVASGAQAHRQGLTERLVDTLLAYGAELDPDGTGGCLWIALYHTVEHRGQRDVARMLYDRGHPIDMCFAAGLGKLDVLAGYSRSDGTLESGADRLYRHHRRPRGPATDQEILQDAFTFACIANRPPVVEFLLDRGVDIDGVRSWGLEWVTGLHGAAWAGWTSMVELLLDRGANPYVRDRNHGSTPVGWAAYCGRRDVLDLFLSSDDNLDLMDALEFGRGDRFQQLFGDMDPNAAVGDGGPGILLRRAAHVGDVRVVEFLLDRGADPNLVGADGHTALAHARGRGHRDVVRLLERHGARDESKGLRGEP